MTQAISVRLADEALRALAQLETTGFIRSAAIRFALVTAAARLSDRQVLSAEVAVWRPTKPIGRTCAVAELMEQLRA